MILLPKQEEEIAFHVVGILPQLGTTKIRETAYTSKREAYYSILGSVNVCRRLRPGFRRDGVAVS